jgi:hypothetical protein
MNALATVDHLVYAVPDLAAGVDHVESLLGIRPGPGGTHPGWGTANALLALGPGRYLEVIGPDPGQPDFRGKRPFRIGELSAPTLVNWAARGNGLEQLADLDLAGERIGNALSASRELAGGGELHWVLTDPSQLVADGLVPFFIDWGDSPHPSVTAPPGAELIGLELRHPDPERLLGMLKTLDLELPVLAAESPAIVATIVTAKGEITLC